MNFSERTEKKRGTVSFRGQEEVGREFLVNTALEKLVATHLGEIEEIEKFGEYRHFFRAQGYEFMDLWAAVCFLQQCLQEDFANVRVEPIDGQVRTKLRKECGQEIEAFLRAELDNLSSRLCEALQAPGPWRQSLCGSVNEKDLSEHETRSNEDLRKRLTDIFGGEVPLLLFWLAKSDVFVKAVSDLPLGETESEIRKKQVEMAEESKKRILARIEEARKLLKRL